MTGRQNRIAVVAMVRDEADVIESFVRHHLMVADAVYIVDHASVDGTSDILTALAGEGLPLAVTRFDGVAQLQAEVQTALMQQAFDDGADLVVPLDADEFLWPEAGRTLADVRTALRALPTDRVYDLASWNCTLVHPEQGEDRLLMARPARRAAQPMQLGKVFVGRAAYEATRAQHGRLLQGNHHYLIDGPQGPSRIVPEERKDVFLAHFPWRSAAQAAEKKAVGWLANVAKYSRQTTKAFHWRDGFFRVLAGEPEIDPMQGAETTALPPIGGSLPEGGRQRYAALAHGSLLCSVLIAAENLAESYRESEVLRRGRIVSIVLPYLGDAEAFQRSLAGIFAEGYPHAELLVLPLAEDAFAAALPSFLAQQETALRLVLLEGADAAARFRDLQASASGDFVQWVAPGRILRPGKLIRMVAALESDDALTFVTSREEAEGALAVTMTEPFQEADGAQIAAAMRAERKLLAGGFTAPLFRRAMMERHGWFASFYEGGAFDAARCWQEVLPGTVLGMMREPQLV